MCYKLTNKYKFVSPAGFEFRLSPFIHTTAARYHSFTLTLQSNQIIKKCTCPSEPDYFNFTANHSIWKEKLINTPHLSQSQVLHLNTKFGLLSMQMKVLSMDFRLHSTKYRAKWWKMSLRSPSSYHVSPPPKQAYHDTLSDKTI